MLRIARARRMSWLLPLSNQQPATMPVTVNLTERLLPTFLNTLGTLLWHSLALRSKETVCSSRPPPGHCGPNSVDQNSGPRCPSPVADSELEGTQAEVPPSPGREAAGAYGGTFGGTCGKGGWWSIPDPNGDFGRQWGHRGT